MVTDLGQEYPLWVPPLPKRQCIESKQVKYPQMPSFFQTRTNTSPQSKETATPQLSEKCDPPNVNPPTSDPEQPPREAKKAAGSKNPPESIQKVLDHFKIPTGLIDNSVVNDIEDRLMDYSGEEFRTGTGMLEDLKEHLDANGAFHWGLSEQSEASGTRGITPTGPRSDDQIRGRQLWQAFLDSIKAAETLFQEINGSSPALAIFAVLGTSKDRMTAITNFNLSSARPMDLESMEFMVFKHQFTQLSEQVRHIVAGARECLRAVFGDSDLSTQQQLLRPIESLQQAHQHITAALDVISDANNAAALQLAAKRGNL